jgi:hypothetical protein
MQKIANSRNIKSKTKSTQKPVFDTQAFLDTAGVARKVKEFKRAKVVYAQRDAANSVNDGELHTAALYGRRAGL